MVSRESIAAESDPRTDADAVSKLELTELKIGMKKSTTSSASRSPPNRSPRREPNINDSVTHLPNDNIIPKFD